MPQTLQLDGLFPNSVEDTSLKVYPRTRLKLLEYAQSKTEILARFQEGRNLVAQNKKPRSFKRSKTRPDAEDPVEGLFVKDGKKQGVEISELLSLEHIHCHSASYADETQFLALRTTVTYHHAKALVLGLPVLFGHSFDTAREEANRIFSSHFCLKLRVFLEFLNHAKNYWLPDRQDFHRGGDISIMATKLLSTDFKTTIGIEQAECSLFEAMGGYGSLALQLVLMTRPQGLCVEMKPFASQCSEEVTTRIRPSRSIQYGSKGLYRENPPSPVATGSRDEHTRSDSESDVYDDGHWSVKNEQLINRYFVALTDEIVRSIPGPLIEAHIQKCDLKVGCGGGKTHNAWTDGWMSFPFPQGKFRYLALLETKTSCAIRNPQETHQRATEMAGMVASDMISILGVVNCKEGPCKL
jgi:hypothetical protein